VLRVAAERGFMSVLKFLLEFKDIDVNAKSSAVSTLENGNHQMVVSFFYIFLQNGTTALMIAAAMHSSCLERLLAHPKIDVNVKNMVRNNILYKKK